MILPLGLAASGHVPRAVEEYREIASRIPHGPPTQGVTMRRCWPDVADDVDEARFALESALKLGVRSRSELAAQRKRT